VTGVQTCALPICDGMNLSQYVKSGPEALTDPMGLMGHIYLDGRPVACFTPWNFVARNWEKIPGMDFNDPREKPLQDQYRQAYKKAIDEALEYLLDEACAKLTCDPKCPYAAESHFTYTFAESGGVVNAGQESTLVGAMAVGIAHCVCEKKEKEKKADKSKKPDEGPIYDPPLEDATGEFLLRVGPLVAPLLRPLRAWLLGAEGAEIIEGVGAGGALGPKPPPSPTPPPTPPAPNPLRQPVGSGVP